MNPTVFLLPWLLAEAASASQPFEIDVSSVFGDFEACFVLLDTVTGERRTHGPACDERSTPASTFKVPHALLALDYGNHYTTSGLTTSWLGGSLTISPLEQAGSLDRLRRGRLLVSERAQGLVRELIVVERREGAVLRGKSGTHLGPDVGWFVGWVERDGHAWVFATRIRGEGARGYSSARRMSREAFARLGLWSAER